MFYQIANRNPFKMLLLAFLILAASRGSSGADRAQPVDLKATKETKALFQYLLQSAGEKILFGHQDSTLRGIGWKGGDGLRSDVKSACGSFPAVYGWDINQLSKDRGSISEGIRGAYSRGGISTISWHMRNPVTGQSFYDTTRAVKAILPGGKKHEVYKENLDDFSKFISGLRDKKGVAIPVIFRPFHEHTGSWFWWGKGNCTADEYARLWRFTVSYLRDSKGLHNLLYAYSPSKNLEGTKEHYLWGYPGDDYVDILGYDHYCQDVREALPGLRLIVKMAGERGKVPAFTETGVPQGMSEAKPGNYYTERLLNPLKGDAAARRIAYVMLWRNKDKSHYWIPYEGHELMADFQAFASDPLMAFEEDI